ncbi:MAG TPA: hypothetical protein VMS17_05255 [Gemmataceae bacterium]|nr:hypothetical protein [Gemmataceae bacterium]
MTICNYYTHDNMSDLIAALDRFADAGIDPAFDAECEELERQFAERRLTQAGE